MKGSFDGLLRAAGLGLAMLASACVVPSVTPSTEDAVAVAGDRPAQAHPDAPAALAQFGRFVGLWDCRVEQLLGEGEWRETHAAATWEWFYTLGGHAVQDLWLPDGEPRPGMTPGTSLRVYDPATGRWQVAWTTVDLPEITLFSAAESAGDMVMEGERGEGRVRVTYHDITEDSFRWRFEIAGREDAADWLEVVRMTCRRTS